ncbi:MAG: hypothetical protein ABIR19_01515 [Ginsengibacter sp.]
MKSVKIKYHKRCFIIFSICVFLVTANGFSQDKYTITYKIIDKDTLQLATDLKTTFADETSALDFLNSLPLLLLKRGYPAASIDSIKRDSTFAIVQIYFGRQISFIDVTTDSIEDNVLQLAGMKATGEGKTVTDFNRFPNQKERILKYYEDNGYPFTQVILDSIKFFPNKTTGKLFIKKGPLYHLDSIRVLGKAKIKNSFLQHYLEIEHGSIYDNSKLTAVSKKLKELQYVEELQPWDVTMLGSGSVLNLYLQQKKSSAIDVLIGYLPANNATGKAQLTGDIHLDLKNSLGAGENIVLNWQQIQPQSPRLHLGYVHPYIFNSSFGMDFTFDLLKKDSSYLQLNSIFGIQYILSATQSAKLFFQNESSFLLSGGVDTNRILLTRTLPRNVDVTTGNFGISYNLNNTNYRLNPRKGNEAVLTLAVGIKKVSRNNDIVNLKDAADPAFDFKRLYDSVKLKTYRIRLVGTLSHYLPVGKAATIKTALNGGWIESPQLFRNELFQIGGYRLLRGFDEESIYANKYLVFTAEYRYLLGTNSYLFGFSDAGFTKTEFNNSRFSNNFISGGIGLSFETKLGLLNLSYAIGKRNDVKFDIRNSSKIHFGYINYF